MPCDVLEKMARRDHEEVLFCYNREAGLRAIIAVHSTILGPALGGLRMWPYASEDDALTDVLRLSRGMTYKAAVAGLALGGGKAVIIGDPKKEKTQKLFEAFGRYVDSLGGRYITAEDVSIDVKDVDIIRTQTKFVVGTDEHLGGSGDPSPYTALGIFVGIKACAKKAFGDDALRGRRILVQGVGAVGSKLARSLVVEGAEVLATDIDPERVRLLGREISLKIVPHESYYDVDCDIFSPCALGGILNDTTIPRLRCRVVAGGANNQLEHSDDHAAMLQKRGILYAPDFVINAGGLISVFREIARYDEKACTQKVKEIYTTLLKIVEISEKNSITTADAAKHLAEERLAAAKRRSLTAA